MGDSRRYRGHQLNWLDADRSGLPRVDPFTRSHLFNPFYFDDDGGACACRLCEPLLWRLSPLPLSFDAWLPTEAPYARNGRPWPDLDAELAERINEFTPL